MTELGCSLLHDAVLPVGQENRSGIYHGNISWLFPLVSNPNESQLESAQMLAAAKPDGLNISVVEQDDAMILLFQH